MESKWHLCNEVGDGMWDRLSSLSKPVEKTQPVQ